MIQAVLRNAAHPEYGTAIISFPIPRENYDRRIELLETSGMGSAVQRDCTVDELHSDIPILKRLEKAAINIDEMDYLAKRLDSFDRREIAQYQAMAEKLNLSNMTDLINLTFCCQQATVITDFSDLEKIGRNHLMTVNGGCCSVEVLEKAEGKAVALQLIRSQEGTVTPYGVVYDNGMTLSQLYDGRHFPGHHYEQDILTVGITSRTEPVNTDKITWLYLPAALKQIERAICRSGIENPEDLQFQWDDCAFPPEVVAAMDMRRESLFDLNDLAQAVIWLSPAEQRKLSAAVRMAEPERASQIRYLAENLDQFEFVPGAKTPADYGRHLIQESGCFAYDRNLEPFYDYAAYGLQRMEQETGQFNDLGYISYHGTMCLEELMMEDCDEPDMQIGGM